MQHKRCLVLYSYAEDVKGRSLYNYTRSLRYFIELGLDENDQVDYLFIIQGFKLSVAIPSYNNVKILRRPNTGYDFGAFTAGIEWLGGIDYVIRKYEFFIFLNPTAIGPLLPKYWPENIHWTEIFISRIKDHVHACGVSIICLSKEECGNLAGCTPGPKIEGQAFATSRQGLRAAWDTKKVFTIYTDKIDVIIESEYGFSKALLKNNMSFDSLLSKYGSSIDWRDEKNWKCNRNLHPTRPSNYFTKRGDNITVHPFETVFYKPLRIYSATHIVEMFYNETIAYAEWAIERKRKKTLLDY